MQILLFQIILILFSQSFSKKLHHIPSRKLLEKLKCLKYTYNIAYDKPKNGKMSIFCVFERFIFKVPIYVQIDVEKDEISDGKELSNPIEIYKHITNDLDLYVQYNKSLGGYTAIFQKENSFKEVFIFNFSESGYHEFKDIMINKESFVLLGGRSVYFKRNGEPDFLLLMCKYPYNSVFNKVDIDLNYKQFRDYKLISLKDGFIAFFKNTNEYIFIFLIYDLDLNFINMKNITYSFEEEIMDIKISKLSETEYLNEFMTCFLYRNKSICYQTKYENSDLTFSKRYQICSCEQTSKIYYNYLRLFIFSFVQNANNKILFICTNNAFLTNKWNYTFILANYENGIIQYKSTHSYDKELFLYDDSTNLYIGKKGLILLNFNGIREYYLSSHCDSSLIYLYVNRLNIFNLESLVYEGFDDLSFSFSYIDEHLQIFKNDKRVNTNEVFNDINSFDCFLNVENPENNLNTSYHLKIEMNQKEYSCDIEIKIYLDTIFILNKGYKCLRNDQVYRVNNILKSNINEEFAINTDKANEIELYFVYRYEPKNNELIFYYNNYTLNCKQDKNNVNNVTCKIPGIILERNKKVYIYSKVSCKNLLNIGWILVHDKYVKDIYDLPEIKYFYEIKSIYDPSENITEFNEKMISYYYWFSCLAYCDDEKIANKECCPDILQEWEIVYHNEYLMDLEALIAFINGLLGKIPSNIIQIVQWLFTYLGRSVYYYNFVILKSEKYKKVIFRFPGTTNAFQFIIEFLFSFLVKI